MNNLKTCALIIRSLGFHTAILYTYPVPRLKLIHSGDKVLERSVVIQVEMKFIIFNVFFVIKYYHTRGVFWL